VDDAPLPKIQQIQLYGKKILMVEGFGKDAEITGKVFSLLENLSREKNTPLPISAYCYCPEGMLGVQTIAYEILDDLGGKVDHIFSPSGGGGLTLAIAKGVTEYKTVASHCKVNCVQPEGNNTIAGALRNGLLKATEIPSSSTQVSGLQVPGILDGTETLIQCRKTGGNGYVVKDEMVFQTQKNLTQNEGIFCEPAGAVSVSALSDAVKQKEISAEDTIVCLITGSGFKDISATAGRFRLSQVNEKHSIHNLSQFLATIKT
jgi:threonine synthase